MPTRKGNPASEASELCGPEKASCIKPTLSAHLARSLPFQCRQKCFSYGLRAAESCLESVYRATYLHCNQLGYKQASHQGE